VAADLTEMFEQVESLADVDNYMSRALRLLALRGRHRKGRAPRHLVDTINRTLAMALGGHKIRRRQARAGHEPVNIVIQVPLADCARNLNRLGDLPVPAHDGSYRGAAAELGRFVRVSRGPDRLSQGPASRWSTWWAMMVATSGAPIYGCCRSRRSCGLWTPDGVTCAAPTHRAAAG
jgi:multidrug efflux pump subunit AcrB